MLKCTVPNCSHRFGLLICNSTTRPLPMIHFLQMSIANILSWQLGCHKSASRLCSKTLDLLFIALSKMLIGFEMKSCYFAKAHTANQCVSSMRVYQNIMNHAFSSVDEAWRTDEKLCDMFLNLIILLWPRFLHFLARFNLFFSFPLTCWWSSVCSDHKALSEQLVLLGSANLLGLFNVYGSLCSGTVAAQREAA